MIIVTVYRFTETVTYEIDADNAERARVLFNEEGFFYEVRRELDEFGEA